MAYVADDTKWKIKKIGEILAKYSDNLDSTSASPIIVKYCNINHVIIDNAGDINYRSWHDESLMGRYNWCSFDGTDDTTLNKDNIAPFIKLLEEYFNFTISLDDFIEIICLYYEFYDEQEVIEFYNKEYLCLEEKRKIGKDEFKRIGKIISTYSCDIVSDVVPLVLNDESGRVIIGFRGDINFGKWHNETLTNQYEWCPFNASGRVTINKDNIIPFMKLLEEQFKFVMVKTDIIEILLMFYDETTAYHIYNKEYKLGDSIRTEPTTAMEFDSKSFDEWYDGRVNTIEKLTKIKKPQDGKGENKMKNKMMKMMVMQQMMGNTEQQGGFNPMMFAMMGDDRKNNAFKEFGLDFGKIDGAIDFQGNIVIGDIALSLDTDENRVNCSKTMGMQVEMELYKIPTQLDLIKAGDLVIVDGKFVMVEESEDGLIEGVSHNGESVLYTVPTNPMNMQLITKIVNPFKDMFGQNQEQGGFNPMMFAMMMDDE